MSRDSRAARDEQELLRPTYQNRLRVVGRHLDNDGFHGASIFEIEGGFVVRATAADSKRPQALEFPDEQFPDLMRRALRTRGSRRRYKPHPSVLPTGYEDFLRALGYLLDNQMATSVLICELVEGVLIAGEEPSNATSGHIAVKPFEHFLNADDIQHVLDDSFSRRTSTRRSAIFGIF